MATTPGSPFTFSLVGAGSVGTAVAELLRRGGHRPVGISSRSRSSADIAAAMLDAPVVDLVELPVSDVILLGVPDAAIADVAAVVARSVRRATVVVHLSGVSGLAPLGDVVASGAHACALHPVQACPDTATAIRRLPGSYWGVTTTPAAREWALDLVHDPLHGYPVEVDEHHRGLWHAAAVSTSNGIAALMGIGENLLRSIGIDDPEKILGPLARGTVENAIAGGGGGKTLTGPAVRGERETFTRHLDAIGSMAPDLVMGYRLAAELVIEAAGVEERIDPAAAAAIQQLLEDR